MTSARKRLSAYRRGQDSGRNEEWTRWIYAAVAVVRCVRCGGILISGQGELQTSATLEVGPGSDVRPPGVPGRHPRRDASRDSTAAVPTQVNPA